MTGEIGESGIITDLKHTYVAENTNSELEFVKNAKKGKLRKNIFKR